MAKTILDKVAKDHMHSILGDAVDLFAGQTLTVEGIKCFEHVNGKRADWQLKISDGIDCDTISELQSNEAMFLFVMTEVENGEEHPDPRVLCLAVVFALTDDEDIPIIGRVWGDYNGGGWINTSQTSMARCVGGDVTKLVALMESCVEEACEEDSAESCESEDDKEA